MDTVQPPGSHQPSEAGHMNPVYTPVLALVSVLMLAAGIAMLRRYLSEADDYNRFLEGFSAFIMLILTAMIVAALEAVTSAAPTP